jgi:endonuclease VIII
VPEGDTVWRTAKRLDHALSGRPLVQSDFRVPRFAGLDLAGQPVVETVSRGKHLLSRLPDLTIHTHLKMEGSWHIYRPRSSWRAPGFQARLILANDDWQAVGFQLGIVEVLNRDEEHDVVGHLGPDLLGPDWSTDEAVRRLSADPSRPIGEALLDQRNLAGIGTVYRAETLYLAGLWPYLPVESVPDLRKVVDLARRLMIANRDNPRQVTTGVQRKGEGHWVYGRRAPCRRCGTDIRRSMQGAPPRDRVVYWCPSCQPRS